MSQIRNKDTRPERIVRSVLHKLGFRFRLHRRDLPGRPDIVLSRYKTVIFVQGCFWHRHEGCKDATVPKSNTAFWLEKFRKNVERDRKVHAELTATGWDVLAVWECETQKLDQLAARIQREFDSYVR